MSRLPSLLPPALARDDKYGKRFDSIGKSIFFTLLIVSLAFLKGIETLSMTSLEIPQHPALNETVRLQCNFKLDREKLYSVKWYKDGHEFYRYVPEEQPDVYVFILPGVAVDMHNSSARSVVLSHVNHDSTGRYRCEVSAEAPAFHTVSDHADMVVIVLPDRGPTITGGKAKYQAGDLVRVNCTSAPSKPHAILMWYVNDHPVDKQFLKGPRITSIDSNGLETAQLGLEFRAWPNHFRQGDMKLKCLATISTVYRKSFERRIAGVEGYLKQPMESRETRAQSHTRGEASVIQSRTTAATTILSVFLVFTYYICVR